LPDIYTSRYASANVHTHENARGDTTRIRRACNMQRASTFHRGILQAETRRIENYFLHYLAHPRRRLCKLPDGFSNADIGRFSERILIINVRMAGGRRFAEQVSNFRASGIKYALTEFRFFEKLLHLKCMASYVTLPTDNFTVYCSYTVRRGSSPTFSLLSGVYY